jgi:hypothetical protein
MRALPGRHNRPVWSISSRSLPSEKPSSRPARCLYDFAWDEFPNSHDFGFGNSSGCKTDDNSTKA